MSGINETFLYFQDPTVAFSHQQSKIIMFEKLDFVFLLKQITEQ